MTDITKNNGLRWFYSIYRMKRQTLVQQKQSIVLGAFFIFAYFCIENKDEYGKSETFNIGFQ